MNIFFTSWIDFHFSTFFKLEFIFLSHQWENYIPIQCLLFHFMKHGQKSLYPYIWFTYRVEFFWSLLHLSVAKSLLYLNCKLWLKWKLYLKKKNSNCLALKLYVPWLSISICMHAKLVLQENICILTTHWRKRRHEIVWIFRVYVSVCKVLVNS